MAVALGEQRARCPLCGLAPHLYIPHPTPRFSASCPCRAFGLGSRGLSRRLGRGGEPSILHSTHLHSTHCFHACVGLWHCRSRSTPAQADVLTQAWWSAIPLQGPTRCSCSPAVRTGRLPTTVCVPALEPVDMRMRPVALNLALCSVDKCFSAAFNSLLQAGHV